MTRVRSRKLAWFYISTVNMVIKIVSKYFTRFLLIFGIVSSTLITVMILANNLQKKPNQLLSLTIMITFFGTALLPLSYLVIQLKEIVTLKPSKISMLLLEGDNRTVKNPNRIKKKTKDYLSVSFHLAGI